ncbi:hypothetical protein [Megasphaera vaginalis (ex Srinivasan et al. 2021)]|uniref:Preprotein translocase subunit SecG n=1 Tax=Megasphaera vaginalis (ex Srinivasan et al. 2021) TaxID=1111454 RepID=U7UFS2_9FIRM|nr:hypothetical protein [Megasphaera vaginalis (ex Srinivasan et al. 2021)]ERT58141.1 hypothetical protein HMPREF1250_0849 [Megasphaera vaginalis (ex Srinivasan et al. 2021)]
MSKADSDKATRVRSAKEWLEKAERSFNDQSDIKGELSLLLAEAEMKNLRKNHGAGQKVLRLGAFGTALFLVAAFFYLWPARAPVPAVPPPAVQSASVESAAARTIKKESAPVQPAPLPVAVPQPPPQESEPVIDERETVPATATAVTANSVAEQHSNESAGQAVLTDRQVEEAVQAGRHTLRSTQKK